jgi:translation elongation factor EF-Tu-like GTPase
LRTADITGKVELPENVKMVMPGDNVTAVFELISPVPLEPGMSKLIKGVACMFFLGIVKGAP